MRDRRSAVGHDLPLPRGVEQGRSLERTTPYLYVYLGFCTGVGVGPDLPHYASYESRISLNQGIGRDLQHYPSREEEVSTRRWRR
jgi:hypothetical protein